MTALITLAEAKAHLRVTAAAEDTLIAAYAEGATDTVINYITQADDTWTDTDGDNAAPALIRMAILLVLGSLYSNRGDMEADYLSEPVKNLLRRYRDPALA